MNELLDDLVRSKRERYVHDVNDELKFYQGHLPKDDFDSEKHLRSPTLNSVTSERNREKYAYVDINVVPKPTAVVKLRNAKQESKIRKFFKRIRSHFRKKDRKKEKSSKIQKRSTRRVRSLNPLKKLKKMFNARIEIKDERIKELVRVVEAVANYTRPNVLIHIDLPTYYRPDRNVTDPTPLPGPAKSIWNDFILKYVSGIALIELLTKFGVIKAVEANLTDGTDRDVNAYGVFSGAAEPRTGMDLMPIDSIARFVRSPKETIANQGLHLDDTEREPSKNSLEENGPIKSTEKLTPQTRHRQHMAIITKIYTNAIINKIKGTPLRTKMLPLNTIAAVQLSETKKKSFPNAKPGNAHIGPHTTSIQKVSSKTKTNELEPCKTNNKGQKQTAKGAHNTTEKPKIKKENETSCVPNVTETADHPNKTEGVYKNNTEDAEPCQTNNNGQKQTAKGAHNATEKSKIKNENETSCAPNVNETVDHSNKTEEADEPVGLTSMCDINATMRHVQEVYNKMNRSEFGTYVKNITCVKYKSAPTLFEISANSKNGKKPKHRGKSGGQRDAAKSRYSKWNWIRGKRASGPVNEFANEEDRTEVDYDYAGDDAGDDAGDNAGDDDSVVQNVPGSVQYAFGRDREDYDRLYLGGDGIYRIKESERKRRAVDMTSVVNSLRNLPPLRQLVDNEDFMKPTVVITPSPPLLVNCGVECQRDLTCSLALLWAKNVPALGNVKDSQETKLGVWKERNGPPPLPPIDFDYW
ncbi:unnamed protein product, partial [Iphiclides podalirius]